MKICANWNRLSLFVVITLCLTPYLHAQQAISDPSKSEYQDKVGDVKKKLPSPEATFLDIKQVSLEKLKSDKFEVVIELASDLPHRPDITIKHYMSLDLDKNKATGKASTADKNFSYDAYVGTSLYKDTGKDNIWMGTYGNLLKDFDFEADRLKIKDNRISFEISSKWFKKNPSFKFRIYNWISIYDEDDKDEISSRTHIDSSGTLVYPPK